MSFLAKLKNAPTAYWVVGLGGAALAVDYLVEGHQSVLSSIYRGVFGHGHAHPRPRGGHSQGAMKARPAQAVAPSQSAIPAGGFLSPSGVVYYQAYPQGYPYHGPWASSWPRHGSWR